MTTDRILNNKNNQIMKKLLYLISAAILVAGVASCKKSKTDNTTAPSISWGISGDTVEIGSKEDASITVSVPEGVESFTIEVILPSIELNTSLNANYISVKDNYASTTVNGKTVEVVNGILDLVGDSKSSSALSLGAVKAATSLSINLAKVVSTLMTGYNAKDGDVFVFNMVVKDAVGKEAKKSFTFHWTAEPSLIWLDGSTVMNIKEICPVDRTDITSVPATFKVTAPAVIDAFKLTVKSSNSDILTPISIYGESDPSIPGGVMLDLIGSPKAAGLDYGVEVGEKLKVTETTLTLTSLIRSMAVLVEPSGEATIQFTFKITDAFDRTLIEEVNYVVK